MSSMNLAVSMTLVMSSRCMLCESMLTTTAVPDSSSCNRCAPGEAVEVDVGDDETRGAAPVVPVNPLGVSVHGDPQPGLASERQCQAGAELRNALEQAREDDDHPQHALRLLYVVLPSSASQRGSPKPTSHPDHPEPPP
jgi:hypothetical protein